MEEQHSMLEFDNIGSIIVEYDDDNNLTTALAKNSSSGGAEVNLSSILDESNTNLTPSQKLLLHWHARFGHKGMEQIQTFFRNFAFQSERFNVASRCALPLCTTCQYAKAHRQSTNGYIKTTNPNIDQSRKFSIL